MLTLMAPALEAQPSSFVHDREKIFAPELTARLDSSLRAYHERSGSYVIVTTDTADVSDNRYADAVARLYVSDTTIKTYIFQLLLSRTHSQVFITVNKHLVPYISDDLFKELLGAGIPLLREKKPGEASELITEKMIGFLDKIKD